MGEKFVISGHLMSEQAATQLADGKNRMILSEGDMKKTTYDPDADGKIANSELTSGENITLTTPAVGQKKVFNCYVENGLLIIVSDE